MIAFIKFTRKFTMNITAIKDILTASYKAGDAVLMNGLHGIGKTEIVKNWAQENDFHLEILYLSTQQVSDLIGIPEIKDVFNGDNLTIWTIPSWLEKLKTASLQGKRTVLLLDEFSRASLDVRQAALQLILDRKIHQHELPELFGNQTLIIAAINPDNGYYSVESLDPALLDRFLSIDVEVDASSWLDWAKENKVNKMVRKFISQNPDKLHFIPDESSGDKLAATPRSWTKLGKFLDDIDSIPEDLHYHIISGKIGTTLAPEFLAFMQSYFDSMVSIKDIENTALKTYQKTQSLQKAGDAVEQLTQNLTTNEILEINATLIRKYIDKSNASSTYPMMAMLYSLKEEVLLDFLESYQKSNPYEYAKIAKFDETLNHKQLFRKYSR